VRKLYLRRGQQLEKGTDMRVEDILKEVDEITVGEITRLTGRSGNAIRARLRDGTLIGRHIGREWVVPVIYDEDGNPVFLSRYPTGMTKAPNEEDSETFAIDVDAGGGDG
jgi:hypothetical protein